MPVFVEIEVGGIQKFIFSTGKLKEMIGGSEIVHYICQEEFYEPVLKNIACDRRVTDRTEGNDWHMLLQNNAGILAILLPDGQKASAFLREISRKVLEEFPALPLFGTQAETEWTNSSLQEARRKAEEHILVQRMGNGFSNGVPMLPILRPARLDGLPAVAEVHTSGSREFLSLASLCKRNPTLLAMSEKRLRKYASSPRDVVWTNDMETMLPNGGKIALIHMDGNDMGKLFGDEIKRLKSESLAENVARMRKLSLAIEDINREAFAFCMARLLEYLRSTRQNEDRDSDILMPLRPLVMGGDDITLIVRADLALFVIHFFYQRYEQLAAERGLPLSLGIGMVVMDSSWPFARAFALVEQLTKSAKKISSEMPGVRPSSLDYLLLTEDVEKSVEDLRRRVFTSTDGLRMTAKPYLLQGNNLLDFMLAGVDVLDTLPRSQIRQALTSSRNGQQVTRGLWLNIRENLERRLGGRKGRLMSPRRFEELFPGDFFQEDGRGLSTRLGDYLELAHLLPQGEEARELFFKIMLEGGNA